MEEMTMKQVARLIEWLKDKGFTDAQILECIEYISKQKNEVGYWRINHNQLQTQKVASEPYHWLP